jgi:hypothetical protein
MSNLKTEKSYTPKIGFEFFYSDPDGDGFVYFKSEQERDDAVNEAIADYLQDGWNEEVENVTIGKITGVAAKVDVTIRSTDLDEDNCDEDGVYWDSDHDYTCNYEIKPVGFVCPSTLALKVGV